MNKGIGRAVLEALIDKMPGRVFAKDKHSRYLMCNAEFAKVAGTTPEGIVGKTDQELWSGRLAEQYVADDREVIETGVAKVAIREKAMKRDGRLFDVLTNKVPLRHVDGSVIGVIGISVDTSPGG